MIDTRDHSLEWMARVYGIPLRRLTGRRPDVSAITTASVPADDRWADLVTPRSPTMFRRLRLMTAQFDNMAEGLIWTADPESPVFTAWIFPATSVESTYTT